MTVILRGDCRSVLPTLPAGRYRTCVTSPPYLLRPRPPRPLQVGLFDAIAGRAAA